VIGAVIGFGIGVMLALVHPALGLAWFLGMLLGHISS
jgi:hypothetical protein